MVYPPRKRGLVVLAFVALVLASARAAAPADAVVRLTADLLDTGKPEAGDYLSKKQREAREALRKADTRMQIAVIHRLADALEKKGDYARLSKEAIPRIADVLKEIALEFREPSVRRAVTGRWRDILKKHPAEVVRAHAARVLGLLNDTESLDAVLESILHDRRVSVRKAAGDALISLAEFEKNQGVYAAVVDLWRTGVQNREAMLWMLAVQSARLSTSLGEPDEKFAKAVLLPRPHLEALEKMADTKERFAERVRATVPLLVEEMQQDTDESIELCWQAARLLGFTHSRAAVAALIERLENTRPHRDSSELPSNSQIAYNLRVQAIASLMEQGEEARKALRQKEHYDVLVQRFRRGDANNDDTIRKELGRLLGWLQEERVLPILLEAIDNEKDRYSSTVRAGAGEGLSELAGNPTLSRTLIHKLLPYLENDSSDAQGWALDALEFLRDQLTDKDQLSLDRRMHAALRKSARNTDFRARVRRLVKDAPAWMDEKHWKQPEYLAPDHPEASWQLAMTSLTLLFVAKARPYCGEESQQILDEAYEGLLGKGGKLEKWAEIDRRQGSDKENVPHNSITVYARVFYLLLLRELLVQETKLTPEQKKRLEEAIAATEKSLRANLEDLYRAGPGHPSRNSVMQTHLFSAALLSLSEPPKTATDGVANLIRGCKNPATVPYYPAGSLPEDERGAAIRSVTFQAATIQLAKTPEERRAAVDRAVRALEAYTKHAWSYRVHATRGGTHSYASEKKPKHAIAPYYAWANYPYITGLIQALAEEKLTDAQREIVAEAREETAAILGSLVQSDGLFTPPNADTYPSGKTWANALAGLAVIPLIREGEGGKGVKPRLGILAPELFRVKGGRSAGAAGKEGPAEKLEVAPRKCGANKD